MNEARSPTGHSIAVGRMVAAPRTRCAHPDGTQHPGGIGRGAP